MITHRGFSAWITSDNQPLEEFRPEIEGADERTVACWIPSEVGRKFEVNWTDIHGGVATAGDVAIDGALKAKCIIHGYRVRATTSAEGVYVSQSQHKPFLFSPLQVTDDESTCVRVSPDLGSISLTIWRVVITEINKPFDPYTVEANEHGPVYEQNKQGGNHVVGFGAPENSRAVTTKCAAAPYSTADAITPWVRFVFRYRPRDLLQANGIVPLPNPFFVPVPPVSAPVSVNDGSVAKIEENTGLVDNLKAPQMPEAQLNDQKPQKRKRTRGTAASKKIKSEDSGTTS
ncbi:hypothetical protein BOTBODRAFT_32243 [Botryobasidium botryosum FD-172 SS1]|uniref:DUF7918 domain-containing protein n=1 Tax=Botryobasidium botryosum (strain FD-172 SS1) TaxID=930990 RepID=A0A067MSS6_BOTB1|nr:hypothetical protein BOTBODRAFT_32243 [Botryobasidium botryosum FD-172 SS1]